MRNRIETSKGRGGDDAVTIASPRRADPRVETFIDSFRAKDRDFVRPEIEIDGVAHDVAGCVLSRSTCATCARA